MAEMMWQDGQDRQGFANNIEIGIDNRRRGHRAVEDLSHREIGAAGFPPLLPGLQRVQSHADGEARASAIAAGALPTAWTSW